MKKLLLRWSVLLIIIACVLMSGKVSVKSEEFDRKLYIPEDIAKQGFTVENNYVLKSIQEDLNNRDRIGYKDSITFTYFGYYHTFGEDRKMSAVFLITNRLGINIDKDLIFSLMFTNQKDVIFDKRIFEYSIKDKGILPDGKTTVYFIEIEDAETMDKIKKIKNVTDPLLRINEIGFKEDTVSDK